MQEKAVRAMLAAAGPTYEQVKSHIVKEFTAGAKDSSHPQQLRNICSALNAWTAHIGKALDSSVGAEFGNGFAAALESFESAQRAAGRQPAAIRDRRLHIRRIRDAYALLKSQSLPDSFEAALDELMSQSHLSLEAISTRSGVSEGALTRWRRGAGVPGERVGLLPGLEQVLGVLPGTLTSRVQTAYVDARLNEKRAVTKRTEFGQRISDRNQKPYTLTTAEATVEFRAEFADLMAYKAAATPELRRSGRGVWRVRPRSQVRPFANEEIAYLPSNRICVAAIKLWTELRQFMGWACLSSAEGGLSMDRVGVRTLAILTVPRLVSAYMEWRINRQGGRPNNFNITFLDMVNSLTHEDTGYLTQSPQYKSRLLSAGLSLVDDDWAAHCVAARRRYAVMRTQMRGLVTKTRPAMASIEDILAAKNPLTPIMHMLERMQSARRPRSLQLRHANHERKILLLALLIANPLRINKMSAIRISGPAPNLYKNECGEWWFKFEGSEFKNEKGAANGDYHTVVPSRAAPFIERYLAEARPYLLNDRDSPYLFVQRKRQQQGRPMRCLADDFRGAVARFLPSHCSFGPHSLRHIVATYWLRTHGAQFALVAKLLHDKLETVMRHYGHIQNEQTFREHDKALLEMSAMM